VKAKQREMSVIGILSTVLSTDGFEVLQEKRSAVQCSAVVEVQMLERRPEWWSFCWFQGVHRLQFLDLAGLALVPWSLQVFPGLVLVWPCSVQHAGKSTDRGPCFV